MPIPSNPHVVSAISGDEEAEMDRLTAPGEAEKPEGESLYAHIDDFVNGLSHEELEYIVSCAQKKLGEEGELDKEVDAPANPEQSGSTENVQ